MQPAFAIITYAGECWSVWDTADTDFCCYEDLYMLVNLPLDDGLDGLSYILHFYIISIYTRSVMASGICPRKAREIRCYMICFINHVHQLPSAHFPEKHYLSSFVYTIIYNYHLNEVFPSHQPLLFSYKDFLNTDCISRKKGLEWPRTN